MPTPAARDGGFQPRTEAGHIFHGQKAAFALLEGHNLARDITAIESRMGGGKACNPTFTRRAFFFFHHVGKAARQIALHKPLTDPRRRAAGQENRRIGRPARIFRDMRRNTFREQRIHRKAFRRVANGVLRHIAKTHAAMAFQSRNPGIGGGRHHGTTHALGDLPAMFAHEDIRRQGSRPMAKPGDGFHLPIGQPDHNGRDTRDIHQIRQQHAKRNASGAACIHRIATRFQHSIASRCRQIMPRRNGMAWAAKGGTGSGHG